MIAVQDSAEASLTAYVEPFVILLILIINACVGVWQESNAEKALEALKEMQVSQALWVSFAKSVENGSIFACLGSNLPKHLLLKRITVDLHPACSPTCLDLQSDTAKVIRNGGEHINGLLAKELVPGDIVELRVGDKVPADMRILKLHTSALRVEQSSLTGESVSVLKSAHAVADASCELQVLRQP